MAFQPLSIGDILMLSQTAWKIGRAFTKGRKSAPAEFAEVEREANGLSEALKLVADTLHTDDALLSKAEPDTRVAVNTILDSASRTLADLESFVERYQVMQKKPTSGGFVVDRSWSDVVLANYKTLKWTTEGGDIQELRNMLQMHTHSISLTMQALQTRSLSRLEKTVVPMAENIASVHDRVSGDLSDKINDVHRVIMAVASSTPSLQPPSDLEHRQIAHRNNSTSTVSTLESRPISPRPRALEMAPAPAPLPVRTSSIPSSSAPRKSSSPRHDSAVPTPLFSPSKPNSPTRRRESGARRMDWDFESGSPPMQAEFGTSPLSEIMSSTPSTMASRSSYHRDEQRPRRESMTLPIQFDPIQEVEGDTSTSASISTEAGRPATQHRHQPPSNSSNNNNNTNTNTTNNNNNTAGDRSRQGSSVYEEEGSPIQRVFSKAISWRSSSSSGPQPVLPPPAISVEANPLTPATPASVFNKRSHSHDQTNAGPAPPRPSRANTARSTHSVSSVRPEPLAATPSNSKSPNTTFERALFRNAAILCDVRGKMVEYAQRVPDEPDPRFDTEMVPAVSECRICVVRKRENREHGGTRVFSSIWTLGDDDTVRCQQKLSEVSETVPYCSYFENEKVSIPPADGGEIILRFHGTNWQDFPDREIKTNWINYIFDSEADAATFQSAVFGRKLIGSYRTTKTTVIHDGLKGAFAFEEQFANIEMLRLWEDDGVATPGAQGGALALMHMSSNFGEGWARWWMNDRDRPTKVKDDGGKWAKIRGIDMTVVKPGVLASKAPVKRVTGIKIEFKVEDEKSMFLQKVKEVQARLMALPPV